jgi:hypothetical protein
MTSQATRLLAEGQPHAAIRLQPAGASTALRVLRVLVKNRYVLLTDLLSRHLRSVQAGTGAAHTHPQNSLGRGQTYGAAVAVDDHAGLHLPETHTEQQTGTLLVRDPGTRKTNALCTVARALRAGWLKPAHRLATPSSTTEMAPATPAEPTATLSARSTASAVEPEATRWLVPQVRAKAVLLLNSPQPHQYKPSAPTAFALLDQVLIRFAGGTSGAPLVGSSPDAYPRQRSKVDKRPRQRAAEP